MVAELVGGGVVAETEVKSGGAGRGFLERAVGRSAGARDGEGWGLRSRRERGWRW